MTTWTNVPDSNLEPGDPIRSVDLIAIKENAVYNYENTTLELLDSQIFTTSGTWTKPGGFDATDSVIAVLVGGGGSGGAVRNFSGTFGAACGGAGGGVIAVSFPYGSLGSTVSVTVGSGGAAVSRTSNGTAIDGNAGGNTVFNDAVAYGGPGGFARYDGNAEFDINFGPNGGGSIVKQGNANTSPQYLFNGGAGRGATTTAVTFGIFSGLTGGGGSAGITSTGNTNRTQNNQATTGVLFGDGGNGSGTGNGVAGSAIGGGGGGCVRVNINATSGAGARGEARIYVVRGVVSGAEFLGFST